MNDVQLRDHVAVMLKTIRIARGHTRPELAKLAGIDVQTLGRYESGVSLPRLTEFYRLCRALKTTPNHVLCLPDERQPLGGWFTIGAPLGSQGPPRGSDE